MKLKLWRPPDPDPGNETAPEQTEAADRESREHENSTPSAGNGFRRRAKRLIIALALWGVLPADFASWLIQRGGMRHA